MMEQMCNRGVELRGKFEVEQFEIGRTNGARHKLRLGIEAPSAGKMQQILKQLVSLGCSPADKSEIELKTVEKDKCGPEDFYSTTNHQTLVRQCGKWITVEDQRMDALIVVKDGRAWCRKLRDIKTGDEVVVGK